MNRAEQFVQNLCRYSFLSLWSIPNPRRRSSSKELCDLLVVCDPDVIIFSVKQVEYKPTENVATGWDRWNSKAIERSVKQIYGGERTLASMNQVNGREGTRAIFLPRVERRRVHRVAVALGSKGEVPMATGDLGRGFVHVFDEEATQIVLRELDTITDFIRYLAAKEELIGERDVRMVVCGEENLMAWYLHNGRSFPEGFTGVFLEADLWEGLSAKEEFRAKKAADRQSYLWDRIIEELAEELDPNLTAQYGEIDDPNPSIERVLRIMAREDRFSRRILAKGFLEFHRAGNVGSRVVVSPSGAVYVFLFLPHVCDRERRRNELLGRCFIARGLNSDRRTVVGIATEQYVRGQGYSFDACLYEKDAWTKEDQEAMERLQKATGAFVSPRKTQVSEREYPR